MAQQADRRQDIGIRGGGQDQELRHVVSSKNA
jgi:hypothetical protein